MTSLWHSHWFFICPANMLMEDQTHITVDLPELSITIQNYRGVLSGFRNVCSHRGTQMRRAGCGHGALRCPYHGWTYNGDGVPVGIPNNADLYGLDASARRELALKRIGVAVVEYAVFVRIEHDGSLPDISGVTDRKLVGAVPRESITCRLPVLQMPLLVGETLGNVSVDIKEDFAILGWVVPDGKESVNATVALYALPEAPDNIPSEILALYDIAKRGLQAYASVTH